MATITVVGGGLAGLVAGIEATEAGAQVRVLEARRRLGGRATSTPPPFVANLGTRAIYDGPFWEWLRDRGLALPATRPRLRGVRWGWRHRLRSAPPLALARAARLVRRAAPVELDLRTWLTDRCGGAAAEAVAGVAVAFTYDHDPGRLSAAFVWDKARRLVFARPSAHYPVGGWGALVSRLASHLQQQGGRIETHTPVDDLDGLLRSGPVILALEPRAARRLLNDEHLRPDTTTSALLDVGVVSRRGDAGVVFDLEHRVFANRYSLADPTLAPDGHDLIQAVTGIGPSDDRTSGLTRITRTLDQSFPGWRDREVWRRRLVVREASGAIDLPGHTWNDRSPIAYADGLWLAGDWVAAPGHLSEVAWASAREAARSAAAAGVARSAV